MQKKQEAHASVSSQLCPFSTLPCSPDSDSRLSLPQFQKHGVRGGNSCSGGCHICHERKAMPTETLISLPLEENGVLNLHMLSPSFERRHLLVHSFIDSAKNKCKVEFCLGERAVIPW